jgi:ArsR family transcriptional regulator
MARRPRKSLLLSPEERKARMERLREARARTKAREAKAAHLAKALAHPARIAILEALRGGGCTCGEIVEGVALGQSTVSQHLKVLKEAGLVTGRSFGPSTRYSLSEKGILELRLTLEPFMAEWDRAARSRGTGRL